MLGAPQLQPAAFPRRAGAEERRGVGQTGSGGGQRDAGEGGGRHRSADAGQQPGTRCVEKVENIKESISGWPFFSLFFALFLLTVLKLP